jgi:hypothetical protein
MMRDILRIVVIVFFAVDGFLNLNGKPNLGQTLSARLPKSVRRLGSAAPYFCIVIALLYLGWFA